VRCSHTASRFTPTGCFNCQVFKMIHKLSLLVLSNSALVLSLPQVHGPQAHFLNPRASHLDWNTPRYDSGFLAKRSDVHSEEYFNTVRRSAEPELESRHVVTEETFRSFVADKRATKGQWENLNGSMASYPSAVSWGGKRMDIYYKGKDKSCQHKSWDGNKWSSWTNLGGDLDSAPATCSWGKEKMDVYVKGTDSACWTKSYDNGKWGDWTSIGGEISHEPSTCTWGKDRMDVYVPAKDGQCWHRTYDKGWSSPCKSTPTLRLNQRLSDSINTLSDSALVLIRF
jgi:hypothetical protein